MIEDFGLPSPADADGEPRVVSDRVATGAAFVATVLTLVALLAAFGSRVSDAVLTAYATVSLPGSLVAILGSIPRVVLVRRGVVWLAAVLTFAALVMLGVAVVA